MSTPVFTPVGISGILSYADDSTDTSTIENGATALLVYNADTANVVAVNVSFNPLDTNAVVPTNGTNGIGTVVGPNTTLILRIPQAAFNNTMYVAVAGVSGTGNVFITPGAI
jgi:hypothetical protein